MSDPDLDVIKEIPGYKVILKAVLKSQIQQLVEQLSALAEEESMLLTADINEKTLSYLGSKRGRVFLSNYDDLKQQFMGFCMKRQNQDTDNTPPCTETGLSNIQSSRSVSSKLRSAQKHSKRLPTSRHVPYTVSRLQEKQASGGQSQAQSQVKDCVSEKCTSSSESAENSCNTRSSLERETPQAVDKSSQDENPLRTCSTSSTEEHETKQEPCDPDDEATCKASQHVHNRMSDNRMSDKNVTAEEKSDETDGNPRCTTLKSLSMDIDIPNYKCDAQKAQNQKSVESVSSINSQRISNEKNKTVPVDSQERKSHLTKNYEEKDKTGNKSNAEKLGNDTDKNIRGEREDMEGNEEKEDSLMDYPSEENSMTDEDGDPPILDRFDSIKNNEDLKSELETNDSLDTVNYSEDNGLELHFSGSEEENIDVGTETQNTAEAVKEVDSQESGEVKSGSKCLKTGKVMEVCIETMKNMTSCVARANSEERKDKAVSGEFKSHADDGKNSDNSSEKNDKPGSEESGEDSQDKVEKVLAFWNEIAISANDAGKEVLYDLIAEKLYYQQESEVDKQKQPDISNAGGKSQRKTNPLGKNITGTETSLSVEESSQTDDNSDSNLDTSSRNSRQMSSESDSSSTHRQALETQNDAEKQRKNNKNIAETNKRITENKGLMSTMNSTATHPTHTSTVSNSSDATSRNFVNKDKNEMVKKVSNKLNAASSETEKDKGNQPIVIDLVDTESKSSNKSNSSNKQAESVQNSPAAARKIQNSPRQGNSNKATRKSQQGTPGKQNFIDDLISKGVPIIIPDEDDDIMPGPRSSDIMPSPRSSDIMPSPRSSAFEMKSHQYIDQLEDRSPSRIKHFPTRQGFSPSNVDVRQQLTTSQQPLPHYQQPLTYQDQHFTQTQQKQYFPDPKFTQSQQNQYVLGEQFAQSCYVPDEQFTQNQQSQYVEDQQLLLSQQNQYMSQQQQQQQQPVNAQQYYTQQQFSSPQRKQLFTPPKNVGPLTNPAILTSGRGRGRGRPKLKPSTTQSPSHGIPTNMPGVSPSTRGVPPSAQPFSPPLTPTTPDGASYLNLKQGYVTPTKQQQQQQQSFQENSAQRQVHLHHLISPAQKQVMASSLPAAGVPNRTHVVIEDKQLKSSTDTSLPQHQNISSPKSTISHLQHLQNMSNMVSKPVHNTTPQVSQAQFTQSTEANLPVISNVTSIKQQSSLDDPSSVNNVPTQQGQQIVYIPMLVSNSDMQVIQQANEQTPVKRAREPEPFTSPTQQFSEPALKRQNISVSDGKSQLNQQLVIETGTLCKSPPPDTVSPAIQISPSKLPPKLEIDVDDVAILSEPCRDQMTALTSPTTNTSYESTINSNLTSSIPLSTEKPGILQSQLLARSELKSFSPPMSPSTRRLHAGPGRRSRNSSSEGSSASSTSSSTVATKTTKSKNFGCGDCGKSFASKQALNVHFKKHTQDRPFECDVCGKHFSQKGYLKKHIHSHFQEKQQ